MTSDTPALDVVRQLGCTPVFPVAQKLNRGVHVEGAILLLLYRLWSPTCLLLHWVVLASLRATNIFNFAFFSFLL